MAQSGFQFQGHWGRFWRSIMTPMHLLECNTELFAVRPNYSTVPRPLFTVYCQLEDSRQSKTARDTKARTARC